MKTRVVWFGRRGVGGFDEQVEIYRRRVEQRWPAEDRVLKPVSGGRSGDPRRVLREEARALESTLEPGWTLVVLDEAGQRMTSEDLARFLRDHEERSTPGLDFVIGSDLGIDGEFAARAAVKLSLSPMTLPHRIARLVLWEQLFRSTHILGGGAYHRSGVDGKDGFRGR